MKTKYLSAMLLTGAITLATSPARADSSDAARLNFSCQLIEGVPTTVAHSIGTEGTQAIFHWKNEALSLKSSSTPKQMCDSVAAKLEDYSAQGYDLSRVSFIGTEQAELPAICANTAGTPGCSKVLLTLNPASNPAQVADDVVSSILDQSLQQEKIISSDRGIQSTSYQVNFWQLLGLNTKFFSK